MNSKYEFFSSFPDDGSIFRADSKKLDISKQSKVSGGRDSPRRARRHATHLQDWAHRGAKRIAVGDAVGRGAVHREHAQVGQPVQHVGNRLTGAHLAVGLQSMCTRTTESIIYVVHIHDDGQGGRAPLRLAPCGVREAVRGSDDWRVW